jgi:sugar phosphate isomerase/epimerase
MTLPLRLTRAGRQIMLNSTVTTASGARDEAPGRSGGPFAPKFSLAHLTVLGCAPPEAAYIAAAAGYDFVSYRIICMGMANEPNYSLAETRQMLQQTRTALSETGLKVLDIELARIADDVDVKSYLPALETAAELGARHLISSIWTPRRNYAVDSLSELCDLARTCGLTVDLEFLTWTTVKNLREAASLHRAVNRENCGLLIDTLHFDRSRVSLDELDAIPRECSHFVHVCDAPGEIPSTPAGLIHAAREDRLDPGQGGIDIAAIVNRLPEIPYSLEIPNLERVKQLGYAGHARLCIENARKYFRVPVRA